MKGNKNMNNDKTIIETTSFLKTVQSSELDNNSSNNNIKEKEKEIEEIVSKYLDLKKKINLLWNKID